MTWGLTRQVVLVDPDERSRRRWRRCLSRGGLRLVEVATLQELRAVEADVVLFDERAAPGGLFAALEQVAARRPGAALLLVATQEPDDALPGEVDDVVLRGIGPRASLRRVQFALRAAKPNERPHPRDAELLQIARVAEVSRVTSELAHRLRSPIAAALGALELAEEHLATADDLSPELSALALSRARSLRAALPERIDTPVGQRRSLQQRWRAFLDERDLPVPPGLLPLVGARELQLEAPPGDELARWLEQDPPEAIAAAIDHLLGGLHLTNALHSVQRTARLLDETRAFSQLPTRGQPIDLQASLERAVHAAHYSLARHGAVELELTETHCVVWGIPAALHQVWTELLRNAGQALRTGRGRVCVCLEIEQPGWATVRVRDDGGGIPDGLEDRIFEPWFTTLADHHGLGLDQARRTLALHGGTIAVEPDPEWTCMRVELPLNETPIGQAGT